MLSLHETKTVETEDDIAVSQINIASINCYQLYNKTQTTMCSMTIDTRPLKDYNTSHIKNALSIPIDIETKSISISIKDHQTESSKSIITAVYLYTNDVKGLQMSDNATSAHLLRIKDTLIEHHICQQDQVFLLQSNYSEFFSKFPFLCESTVNMLKTEVEEMKCSDAEGKKANRSEKRRRFMQQNKGIYPNQIINDRLYLGDKNGAISETVLRNLKITHIVNCTPLPPSTQVETFTVRGGYVKNIFANDKTLGIKYLRVAIDDSYMQNIKAYFEQADQFINSALQKSGSNRVYVHCYAGKSRSATIVIAYLMKNKGMSYEEAYCFTKERREVIQPNRGFTEQLKKYEQELKYQSASNTSNAVQ
eukprot:192562_1